MNNDTNPWNLVPLGTYEAHMSLPEVAQIQALNRMMKSQFSACPEAASAAVLGVAGGNGLEHAQHLKLVYGIDINQEYLDVCGQRYGPMLGQRLRLLRLDVNELEAKLPEVDLILADLFIEYVGIETFCEKAVQAGPRWISCVIQASDQHSEFVSESPYQNEFQAVSTLHQDVDEAALTEALSKRGYHTALRDAVKLPNGKMLLRVDYTREAKGAPK